MKKLNIIIILILITQNSINSNFKVKAGMIITLPLVLPWALSAYLTYLINKDIKEKIVNNNKIKNEQIILIREINNLKNKKNSLFFFSISEKNELSRKITNLEKQIILIEREN